MNLAGKIEVVVPDCPRVVPNVSGIPSWVVGWGFAVGTVLIIALIVGITIAVVTRNEQRTERFRVESKRKIELAKLHKTCDICGSEYKPGGK